MFLFCLCFKNIRLLIFSGTLTIVNLYQEVVYVALEISTKQKAETAWKCVPEITQSMSLFVPEQFLCAVLSV